MPTKTPVAAAAQRQRVDARAFQRFPGGLQQQPLLGVHGQRLARGDAEERRVELGGVVQEAAVPGVDGAVRPGPGRSRLDVPAAVGGHGGDRVPPGEQQLPQLVRAEHAAGEPAAHRRRSRSGRRRPWRGRGGARRGRYRRAPRSRPRRCAASAAGVGWSKTRVTGNAQPGRARRAGCAARPRSASRSRGPGTPAGLDGAGGPRGRARPRRGRGPARAAPAPRSAGAAGQPASVRRRARRPAARDLGRVASGRQPSSSGLGRRVKPGRKRAQSMSAIVEHGVRAGRAPASSAASAEFRAASGGCRCALEPARVGGRCPAPAHGAPGDRGARAGPAAARCSASASR